MTMTDERLAELDAVMAKATAGGWSAKTTVKAISVVGPRNRIAKMAIVPMSARNPEGQDDAAAIVALHNAYPDLRAHIDALAATIVRLREAAKRIADHPNFYITACECGEPECATTQFIAAIAEAEGAQ